LVFWDGTWLPKPLQGRLLDLEETIAVKFQPILHVAYSNWNDGKLKKQSFFF